MRIEWIGIEWIRIGGIRIGGIRIGGIRVEWICVGYVWCEIRQQSSEEPCAETSFGKKTMDTHVSLTHVDSFVQLLSTTK